MSRRRRGLAGVLALLAAAASARAGWLELGAVAVRAAAGGAELRRLVPATSGAMSLEDRLDPADPGSFRSLPGDSRLLLVSFKHEDPRPAVRRVAELLVDAGGTLLVAASAEGRRALDALAGDSPDHPHLLVRPAPESGLVVRRWAAGGGAEAESPGIRAAVDQVDGDRWWQSVLTLVAHPTRNSRTQGIWDAAEWARGRFEALGLQAAIEPFPFSGGQAPNVVARLYPGSDRPVLLVGAHLDSINLSGQVAPGADDNASGAAAVLEAARVLAGALTQDPGVELRFALFSGEEQGLHGSRAMAKALADSGELARVAAMINLDMLAFDQGGSLDVTLESEAFNQAGIDRMAALAATYTSLAVSTSTNAWGSDHVPFLDRGVKAILPIEGEYDDNPHDHTSHDVAANLNPALAVQVLRLVVASALDTVAAHAAGRLSVTLASEGAPVGGIATLTGGAGEVRVEVPAAAGTVTARVPPGSYTMTVQAFGYLPPEPRSVEVVVDQVHAEAFELAPAPAGTLAGRVLAPDGAGVAARVELVGVPVAPVQAGADGSFSLEVPHGTYRLRAVALGYRVGELAAVAVPGEAVAVTLQPVPPTLLVDDDGDKDYQAFFEAALEALGEPYLGMQAGALSGGDQLAPFSTIIWQCGDRYQGILPEGIRPALRAFVEAGGRLVISGQDVGYGLKQAPFYREVLGARFVKDSASSKRVHGAGLALELGGDSAGNQQYPDVIEADADATAWLHYGADGDAGEGAALWRALGQGRAVTLGFGLEGVHSPEGRRDLLGACLQASDAAGARRRLLAARWAER